MKGHMQDGKFHPHTDYRKGVRKSRDQKLKTQGIKITRKARAVKANLPDVDITEENWGFQTMGGKILPNNGLELGNWTTAGWHWDGDEDDIVGYLIRINKSGIDDFIEKMEGEGVTYNKLKPLLMSKVNDGTWLYEISGDNVRWHFNDDIDEGAVLDEQMDGMEDEYNEEQIETITDAVWDKDYSYSFEDFEEDYGDRIKKEIKEFIRDSNTYQEFFDAMNDESFTYQITEDYVLGAEDKIRDALFESIEKLKKEGELKPTREQRMEKQVVEGGQKRL